MAHYHVHNSFQQLRARTLVWRADDKLDTDARRDSRDHMPVGANPKSTGKGKDSKGKDGKNGSDQ